MSKVKPVSIRFSRWNNPIQEDVVSQKFFSKLISVALNREVKVVYEQHGKVDIGIESVYGPRYVPTLKSRASRFVQSYLPRGIEFSGGFATPNQQPTDNARFSLFWTGENERPPEGMWDVYLSFDLHSFRGRNAYLPLWWLTCSDILLPTPAPYLGKPITIKEMLSPRKADYHSRKKFCVAFIGKAYPFRMHALSALSSVGKVDVFGGIARNTFQTKAKEKFEIAQQYKFVFCFENDLYPGYVTEKAPEAWATGAVPLYWGSDSAGYFNDKAMLNLAQSSSLESYVELVKKVYDSKERWEKIASQPLLQRRPSLAPVIQVLRDRLSPLVKE